MCYAHRCEDPIYTIENEINYELSNVSLNSCNQIDDISPGSSKLGGQNIKFCHH